VHPHGLRHTHASELRQEGVDLGIIGKQLGHASIATTARYIDHLCPQAVVDAMQARQWRM
jgi:integrase